MWSKHRIPIYDKVIVKEGEKVKAEQQIAAVERMISTVKSIMHTLTM